MSLIPYNPPEGREIVLRHQNAIVVRDTSSQRLEIRSLSLTECPTCHQPLRSAHPDDRTAPPTHDPNYVDPNYFRMLRNRMGLNDEVDGVPHTRPHDPARSRNLSHSQIPSSPILRLTRPVLASAVSLSEDSEDEREPSVESDGEFDRRSDSGRIRREAFMPNYFKTFFVEEGVLGKGGKGVVLLVRHEIDGCHLGHYACKRVPVGDNHEWLEKVLVEVELLSKFSHPNLVQFRHVWLEDVRLSRFGPRVACAFILQKYCNGGDLLHYVIGDQFKETTKEELKARARRRSRGQGDSETAAFRRLAFEDIYSLFKDITSGLAYLHAANYVHRDLKPGNCLLHSEGGNLTCLISDFGEVQPENVMRQSTGSTGTISYCAPEVLRLDIDGHYSNFTTKSDMFSLGMVLYFLCFGRLPYHGANMAHEELEDVDALREEISGWEGFREERRSRPDLPFKLYQLLGKLLAPNPAERPSAAEVLTAMNSESSLDGVPMSTRAGRAGSPVVELHGRRIQNLDSPLPSSTPEPLAISVPSKGFPNTDSDGTTTTTLHPPPPSPHHAPNGQSRANLTPPLSSRSLDPAPTTPISTRFTAPLLLPPPTTRMGVVHYGIRLGLFHACHTLSQHIRTVSLVTRFGIFLLKMVTIARPCWPYAAPAGVALPLMALAGVDLAMHGGDNWRRLRIKGWHASALLLGTHFAMLGLAERSGGMCPGGRGGDWGHHHDL